MDVNITLLNGVVEEEVHVEQPLGFETHDKETHVCKLKKALYVLKQAPKTSHDRMDSFLMSQGFTKIKVDSNLYFKVEGGRPMMLLLYVDDLLLTSEEELIKDARRRLAIEFEMQDLGMMNYFLGMEVWKNVDGIFLGQGNYAVEILKKFRILDYKAITRPVASNLKLLCDSSLELVDAMMYCHVIGSLVYLTNMRPDICFAVNTLS